MKGSRWFLGVDGGGTKTEFVCIDAAGKVAARQIEGTTYHLQVGLDGAVRALEAGIAGICAQLDTDPGDLAFVFCGLPAFGEDAAIDPQLAAQCGRLLGHGRYRCGNDMICGWAGSLACADGINLVAGTGSIGYGERQGKAARVGGWGELFSDEGSAYWIAVQGLNAFSRMSDGRLPRGPLHEVFRQRFDLVDDLDICAQVMGEQGLQRDGIAGLAPVVAQAVAAGDAVAIDIHERAADELAAMARALRETLGFDSAEAVPLSWSGGVLANDASVRGRLEARLGDRGRYDFVEPRHSPAYGAALYAAHLAGATIP
ncbi:BadF/BadG/BcrA/BcrD ATPase family protein [Stakelama sediminis]|uniref:N-acetylglucosamine kinase-like BadF-type ATPase n=1 Tax=Stakelama sediminis TaxID=463200 RepID=A0A840Z071_9SPHN|nr:BadF/BadG/BcrA/BcrD ATPase family protein [Stakelama sediminis]MBB5719187.1 N-acetylglucosamine kinase-like BadF-type ATPase [Stakelama sediminis]